MSTLAASAHERETTPAYDLRIYDVAAGELETLEKILRELALPMMPDFGMRALGFWSDRSTNTLYQISEHASLASIDGDWDRFHADPRWQVGLKEHRQERTVVKGVQTVRLFAIPGLPPSPSAPAP